MRAGAHRSGVVLVAVLLLSAVAWALVALALTQAWVHVRLTQATVRSKVAASAAEGELQRFLAIIALEPSSSDAASLAAELSPVGACSFRLVDLYTSGDATIVTLEADYLGTRVRREGSLRSP
jgi:hypothetical protein